jgi:hypothetical protein
VLWPVAVPSPHRGWDPRLGVPVDAHKPPKGDLSTQEEGDALWVDKAGLKQGIDGRACEAGRG